MNVKSNLLFNILSTSLNSYTSPERETISNHRNSFPPPAWNMSLLTQQPNIKTLCLWAPKDVSYNYYYLRIGDGLNIS